MQGKIILPNIDIVINLLILDHGLRDYVHFPTPAERIAAAKVTQEEAELWLMSEEESVGSFLWCCKVLSLDAEELRDGAVNERAEKEAGKRKR